MKKRYLSFSMASVCSNDHNRRTKKPHRPDTDNKTLSTLLRALVILKISGQSKAWIEVFAKLHGTVVIQPEPKFFDMHKVIRTNRFANVELDGMFQLLIAIAATQTRLIVKSQMIAPALVNLKLSFERYVDSTICSRHSILTPNNR